MNAATRGLVERFFYEILLGNHASAPVIECTDKEFPDLCQTLLPALTG